MHLVNNAMLNSAGGWFSLYTNQMKTYGDFCILFSQYCCNRVYVKEYKRMVKNTKLEWLKDKPFEQQILLVVSKFKKILIIIFLSQK